MKCRYCGKEMVRINYGDTGEPGPQKWFMCDCRKDAVVYVDDKGQSYIPFKEPIKREDIE